MSYKIAEYVFRRPDGKDINVIPIFNDGFEYTYTETSETTGPANNRVTYITRTITSNELPSVMSFDVGSNSYIQEIKYANTSNITSMNRFFYHCIGIETLDLTGWDTSKVTDMSYTFAKCYGLTTVKGLDTIDTSKVTNMSYMFDSCNTLSTIEKINNMDTSSVTEMTEMFNGCYSLSSIDLSGWNTSNLVDAIRMFDACTRLRTANLSGLDFSSLAEAYYMFNNCMSLESVDLSGITTWAKNISIRSMFEGCSSLTTLKLGGLTQHITSCYDMFKGATALKSIIIDNSSIDSINQIINKLPTRTSDSCGTITVPKTALSSVDTTTANSKYWNVVKEPEYSFTMNTLKYFLNKLKEKFALKSEADIKVDKVNGKDLVTNDYTDEHAQLNNKAINDITISNETDTEMTLTFSSKNGDSSSIRIPYDKHKKSALFVDAPEKFTCLANEENKINYRYISSLKDGNHRLVVEIVKSTGTSTNYQESYTYDKIPDYYLYIPDKEDIELRMYFIDPENTMTGITYLEPEVYCKNDQLIVSYETTNPNNEQPILAKDTDAFSNNEVIPLDTEGIEREITNINDTTYNVSIYKTGKSLDVGFVAFGEDQNLTKLHSIGNYIQDIACVYCFNLKGKPLYANNSASYLYCLNLTGPPVCGPNVTNMCQAYYNCINLTGNPVCGPNVTYMVNAYCGCKNLSSNGYFYSNKITNVYNCFASRNTSKILNLYVPLNSTTLTTCLSNSASYSLTGTSITWTNDTANNRHYNTAQNIYIYPVANVEQTYKDNEK